MLRLPFKAALLTLLSSIAVLTVAVTSNSQNQIQPVVWTASAMEAIAREQPSPNNIEQLKDIQLFAARGEYEPFQIVVQSPAGNLADVRVDVSDLTSSDGSVIDRQNISLFREHYIQLDRPSFQWWPANPTRGRGLYADGLIPFVNPETGEDIQGAELDAIPFNLPAQSNQPIWVDVFVPRSATPGEYQASYTVESDRGSAEGKIKLTVWDFELPVQPSFDSFFDIWEDRGIEAQTLILQHRLMSSQRIEYPDQAAAFEALGVKSVRLPFWSGANYQTCTMDPAPTVAELEAAAALFPLDVQRYVFSVDEIDLCQGLEQPLKQWGQNVHAAGLKHFAVMKPKPGLYNDVDIWVLNPKMYAEAQRELRDVRALGDEVWFYTGYSTDYSPLWHLDSSPINFRIPQGWIAHSLDLQGVQIARVDTWTERPWEQVPIYEQGDIDYPGIEMLFYPGDKVGLDRVVPSIRLKRLREGMEDYEYTELLKNMGQERWAMNIVRKVGRDWRHWTKNPQVLYQARQTLGSEIDRLARLDVLSGES